MNHITLFSKCMKMKIKFSLKHFFVQQAKMNYFQKNIYNFLILLKIKIKALNISIHFEK